MTETPEQWLRREFDRCKPWIQAALDRDIGTHRIDDVWSMLESGSAQLWPLPHGVMVTTIEVYPQKKLLRGWLSGGDLKEIQDAEPRVRAWGESQGCDLVGIAGRKGWLRAFKGYSEAHTVMVRLCRADKKE